MRSNPFEQIRCCYDDGELLPGLAYRDDEVFAAESETILRDGWTSVACGQNVARCGDLFPVRIAGQSLLILRDDDDTIRVFYNLCRHRGAPLADVQCSARAGRITCPYHAWSYGLDGELLSAPHFHREASGAPSDAERGEFALLSIRTAVWRDIVFVNLSGNAPPFEAFIRPLDERLARWTPSELRPLSSDEYEIRANWKLTAENFLDGYHLPIVHPQIGNGFGSLQDAEDLEISDDIMGIVFPQFYAEDPEQVSSPLPDFPDLGENDRHSVEAFVIFPNTLILVEPDNQQVIVLRPQAPDLTIETFANYVVSDASQSEELAKDRDELYQSAIEINDQDASLLARLQMTRAMDVGVHTHLTQAWDQTNQRFQRLWGNRLLASVDQ